MTEKEKLNRRKYAAFYGGVIVGLAILTNYGFQLSFKIDILDYVEIYFLAGIWYWLSR